MPLYVKKVQTYEAIQLTITTWPAIRDYVRTRYGPDSIRLVYVLDGEIVEEVTEARAAEITTDYGTILVPENDYILKDINGFIPLPKWVFENNYELKV